MQQEYLHPVGSQLGTPPYNDAFIDTLVQRLTPPLSQQVAATRTKLVGMSLALALVSLVVLGCLTYLFLSMGTAVILEGLKRKELLPEQHIVDTGYVDAKLLVESQQDYQIDLVGPTRATINGKPINRKASMPIIFSSIGNTNRPPAQRDAPAVAGPQR